MRPVWTFLVVAAFVLLWSLPVSPTVRPVAAAPATVAVVGSTLTFTSAEELAPETVFLNVIGANYRISANSGVTPGAGCVAIETTIVDCAHASVSTIELNLAVGATSKNVELQNTVAGDVINVLGGPGGVNMMVATANATQYAAVNFSAGDGQDLLIVNDAGLASQTWAMTSGLMKRSDLPGIAYSGVETTEFWGGDSGDTLNIGSTESGVTNTFYGYGGDDTFRVAAAGLGATGVTNIVGGNPAALPGDTLTVYDGGLAVNDNNAGMITTAGRQPVLYMAIEQRSIVPSVDSDTDGCSDVREAAGDHILGGDRSPLDFWDFYDVTDDQKVDLSDALAILGKFGLGPPAIGEPDNGYVEAQDRVSGPANKPWRSAKATGGNIGMTLQDVLANLQAFGDDCTVQG